MSACTSRRDRERRHMNGMNVVVCRNPASSRWRSGRCRSGRRGGAARHPPHRHLRHRLSTSSRACTPSFNIRASWATSSPPKCWRRRRAAASRRATRSSSSPTSPAEPASPAARARRIAARRCNASASIATAAWPSAIVLPEKNLYPAEGLSLDQAAMVEFLAIGAHAVRRSRLIARRPRAGGRRRPDRHRHGALRAASPAPR